MRGGGAGASGRTGPLLPVVQAEDAPAVLAARPPLTLIHLPGLEEVHAHPCVSNTLS